MESQHIFGVKSYCYHYYGNAVTLALDSWLSLCNFVLLFIVVLCRTSYQSFFYPGSSDTTIKVYDIFKQYFTHSFKGSGDVVRLMSILMHALLK